MKLIVNSVDFAPDDLYHQIPFAVNLIKKLEGIDKSQYWLGKLETPINWLHENQRYSITHISVSARWEGTIIEPNVKKLPIGIAFITDLSLLDDSIMNFEKCKYAAIGIADVVDK